MFQSVARRKLSDGVVEQLMKAIDDGEYTPGDALPSERDLMVAFGVGRPAIREALLLLQAKGLVEIRHGSRARVANMKASSAIRDMDAAMDRLIAGSAHVIDDIKEARLVLETAIVRRAAERASDADIERLMAALEDNRRAIPSRDAYLATDIALHRTIASISGNAVFEAASATMLTWLARFRVDMVHVEGANLLSHDEHARIVHAIAARDPDAAERAMAKHQRRSHALYRRLGANRPATPSQSKSKSIRGGKPWSKQKSSP